MAVLQRLWHSVAGTSEPRCPRYDDPAPGSGSLQLGLINVAYRRCVLGRPSVRARPRSWSSVSPCRVTIRSLLLYAGLEVFVSMPHTSPGGQRQDAFCMVGYRADAL